MIKQITYDKLERVLSNRYPDKYRHDRADLYRADVMWDDPVTMSVKIRYEIESVECNPDFDW